MHESVGTSPSEVEVRRYRDDDDAGSWDEFVRESFNGTFLHTRRFLSYHKDRFEDRSLILMDGKGRTVGLFPAALDPADDRSVVSHPGSTYGGIVHGGRLTGMRMVEGLRRLVQHYREAGIRQVVYKAVPYIYHAVPAGDDSYALFRLGAHRYRCDLASTIDLAHRPRPSERRRRGQRSADRAGVEVVSGAAYLKRFWPVLADNLRRRHQTKPVHTLSEIELLQERFPEHIECTAALLEDEVVAGILLFKNGSVAHAQYIASSSKGQDITAMDALLEAAIRRQADSGTRYFDFGVSTEAHGRVLNEGLHRFKSEFGAGAVPYEFYRLDTSIAAIEGGVDLSPIA